MLVKELKKLLNSLPENEHAEIRIELDFESGDKRYVGIAAIALHWDEPEIFEMNGFDALVFVCN